MESHLHREQVLGNEKKKKPEICSKFLQKRNSYEPTLNIFSQKRKIKVWHTQACCPEIPLKAAQKCYYVLPRDATARYPQPTVIYLNRSTDKATPCRSKFSSKLFFKYHYCYCVCVSIWGCICVDGRACTCVCMGGETWCLPQSLSVCLFVHFETRSLPDPGGHQFTRLSDSQVSRIPLSLLLYSQDYSLPCSTVPSFYMWVLMI